MNPIFTIDTNFLEAIPPEIINSVAARLGLQYVHDEKRNANVCYADLSGLRPEFRQTFSKTDLQKYIKHFVRLESYRTPGSNLIDIPYPANPETFWKIVDGGKL